MSFVELLKTTYKIKGLGLCSEDECKIIGLEQVDWRSLRLFMLDQVSKAELVLK